MASQEATTTRAGGSSLGHLPGSRWQFDESVTSVFSDMLERSIPEYRTMRKCVLDLGCSILRPSTTVVELGCSNGDGLAEFVEKQGTRNRYLGVDVSSPMLEAARQRFHNEINQGLVRIERHDLRTGTPNMNAGLTLCILTLQFVPIEYRQRIVSSIYESTIDGGALILVEKVLGSTAEIHEKMVSLYHSRKRASGYSEEEVERKRLSLEGVLVPVTSKWNEELLRDAGFRHVDSFWRWMNFAGWIAKK